jgi:hypothetical protein
MSDPTPQDEHAGQGGSYLLDPATGERVLIERTQEPAPADPTDAAPAAKD